MSIKIKWAPSLGKLTSCSSLSGNFCKIIRRHLRIFTHGCVKLLDPLHQQSMTREKCWVHGKHVINDASVKPCIMLARFLRKFTYLVCVQWNEFLTEQDIVIQIIVQFLNTQECTLLASSYIFIFLISMFCFVCLSTRNIQLPTDISGQTWADATFNSKNYWSLFS